MNTEKNEPKSGFHLPDIDPGEEVSTFKQVLVMGILLPASFFITNMLIMHPDLVKFNKTSDDNSSRVGYGIFDSEIKADQYEIELRTLDGKLIDTIYPAVGTSFYPTDNIPLVKGNTVTYVLSGGEGGRGGNTYGTATAPMIIVKPLT